MRILAGMSGLMILALSLVPEPVMAEGALAMGTTGNVTRDGIAYGGAYNFATREAAMAEALAKCRSYQGAPKAVARCKVVSTFRRSCYAVANDPEAGTPGTGWATGPDKQTADSRALQECHATSPSNRRAFCVVDQSYCDVSD